MPSGDLDWMPVSESFTKADGARASGQAFKSGLSAIAGEYRYYEIWPSEPPEHLADNWTLTFKTVKDDGDEVEELGRFETVDEAKEAAQQHYSQNGS